MSHRHDDGTPCTVGLILSGGGADGAYAAGVVRALAEGRSPATGHVPFDPDIVTGTSVGSINAAALVGEDLVAASRRLQALWLDRLAETADHCGNGVFRFRADPFVALDPRCYLADPLGMGSRLLRDGAFLSWLGLRNGVELASHGGSLRARLLEAVDLSALVSWAPLEASLAEAISWSSIRASRRRLLIAATNWASGRLEVFENDQFSDELGVRLLLASCAIPGFFAPAEVSGQPYVDGGVLMNTPLRPAIHAGADHLHVIYLDPGIQNIPVPRISGLLSALYRTQLIAWAERMNDDIEDARGINDGLLALHRSRHGGEVAAAEARNTIRTLDRLASVKDAFERYRPLTIHRYHPVEDLGGALGILDLQRGRLEELMRRGEDDAENHDCAEAGCVLPPPDLVAAAGRTG